MGKIQVLFLSRTDIEKLDISFEDYYNVVRDALIEHGNKSVFMPPKFGIHPFHGAHCNAMPAYIPKLNALGLKWVSGFPENRKRKLPYIIGTLIINDDRTGAPLAILEASWITAMRTGIVAALVVQTCSKKNSKTLGLVGAGVQARFAIKAISHILHSLEEIRVYDINPKTSESFIEELSDEMSNIKFIKVENDENALKDSEIMLTATSFVEKPYVKKDWLREGDLGVLVHHRGWENESFFRADKLVVDDWVQTKTYGMEDDGFYGSLPDCYGELGEILAGKKLGRENERERIIGITCGLAIEDVAMGKMIYEKALKENIGTFLNFI